jgi:DNA-binding transcriptional regulator YhcF (GntR family)
MSGWIKLHRSILEWEWADDNNLFSFFVKLLIKVNFEDKKWKGHTVKSGQIISSYKKMGVLLGFSESSVKRYLNKLSETGEVTLETKPGLGIVVTIPKYADYQMIKSKGLKDLKSDLKSDLLLKKIRNKEYSEIDISEIGRLAQP